MKKKPKGKKKIKKVHFAKKISKTTDLARNVLYTSEAHYEKRN